MKTHRAKLVLEIRNSQMLLRLFFQKLYKLTYTFSNIFFTRVHILLPSDGNFFYLASYCA